MLTSTSRCQSTTAMIAAVTNGICQAGDRQGFAMAAWSTNSIGRSIWRDRKV